MYQKLFDQKHRLVEFSPVQYIKGIDDSKHRFSGEYESYILCNDCENKLLSSYETYASKAIYGGQLRKDICPACTNYKTKDGLVYTHCKNVDYAKYKLFLLSILWRSSISNRPIFDQISLGPHEEKIRTLILSGDPGNQTDYPILQLTYLTDKSMPSDLIAQPQKRKSKEGHTIYVFVIGGMIYNFYVGSTSHKFPDFIKNHTILPTGEFTVHHLPKGQAWQTVNKIFGIV